MKKIIVLILTMATLSSAAMAEQALYERWDGSDDPDTLLTESSTPDYTELLTSTEWGVGDDDSEEDYRARITAMLVPPVTGDYIFWLVSDDNGRLWLSTDNDPANAKLIAEESSWAAEEGWGEVGNEAQSDAITLVGGNLYWLRGGYQEGNGGDHIRIAWGSTDAGIADHTIITEEYIGSDTARYPSPTHGATNVPTTAVLEWDPPEAFTPIAYDVYLTTDPNADKPEHKVVNHALQTTYDDPCDLDYETPYYWRVNTYDPCDVIRSPGAVWKFTTWPVAPVFTTDAESTTVEAGSSAEFYVQTPRSNTFQWYKEPATAVNDGDDGGDISVVTDADSSTLTISNVEAADEDYYYCVATGTGSTESNHARLLTKRLMGYWKFTSPPSNALNDETAAGNNGTLVDPNVLNPPPGSPTLGPGINATAINLTGGEVYVDIPNQDYFNFHAQGFTVSAWVKTEQSGWGAIVSKTDRKAPRTGWVLHHDGDSAYMTLRGSSEVNFNGGLADNEWHMVAGTYDGDTGMLSLYVDGEKQDEDGPSFTIAETDMPLKIGIELGSDYPEGDSAIEFDGWIDDVQILSYPQDAYEIATAYTDYVDASICVEPVEGDQNDDCVIGIAELIEGILDWLECGIVPAEICD
jgi:hypothetical protein